MSGPFGSSQWMYSSGGFYPTEIDQSLRFNDDDSAYLSWTPASAGNRKTWTFSAWVKKGNVTEQALFDAYSDDNNRFILYLNTGANGQLQIFERVSGTTNMTATSAGYFRDPSAWYHIIVAVDTTQATASDRLNIYVNGEQILFASATYPSQNYEPFVNAAVGHSISSNNDSGGREKYYDGYLAEVNFIDGQALDPTDFGEFKSGVWVAKSYAGSYGTNGFYLNFSDSANIGDDLSGNANDWTANNLVATDVVLDSPTQNWATLNPIGIGADATMSNGSLQIAYGTSSTRSPTGSTIGVASGKWYWEVAVTAASTSPCSCMVGLGESAFGPDMGNFLGSSGNVTSWAYSGEDGQKYTAGGATAYGATFASGDIVGVAFDADAGTLTFYKNGSSQGTAFTGITGATYFPAIGDASGVKTFTAVANFGQDSSFAGNKTAQGNTDDNGVGDFYYAPPSGYLALCTANLPDPVIDPAQDDVPEDYFNTVLYTGNGSTQSITGVNFQPDFVWLKARSQAYTNSLNYKIGSAIKRLSSNETVAELESSTWISSFDSDGFTLGNDGGTNGSGVSFVAWNWLAGNGTSSNTDGSISSTVSVNQKAGFSIVSYTGTGSAATVGHGLSAVPAVIIVKDRDATQDWNVYHHENTSAPETDYLVLNGTDATADGAGKWNDTAPTSSVFTIGTANSTNNSGNDFIAYCFAEVEGYSKFGSYTGNGSTDGPFVYCGFRPAWVLFKPTNRADEWRIMDAARNTYNVLDGQLYANNSSAELFSTNYYIDFLSNGFKPRSGHDGFNRSGDTYIYMAFAEMPAKYSLGR